MDAANFTFRWLLGVGAERSYRSTNGSPLPRILTAGAVAEAAIEKRRVSRTDVENAAWELAEAQPGIDVSFFGHTHRELPEKILNGVLLSPPKNWGISLVRADVNM
jgi:hypothetical protein